MGTAGRSALIGAFVVLISSACGSSRSWDDTIANGILRVHGDASSTSLRIDYSSGCKVASAHVLVAEWYDDEVRLLVLSDQDCSGGDEPGYEFSVDAQLNAPLGDRTLLDLWCGEEPLPCRLEIEP